jgi:hypothetical protein
MFKIVLGSILYFIKHILDILILVTNIMTQNTAILCAKHRSFIFKTNFTLYWTNTVGNNIDPLKQICNSPEGSPGPCPEWW